MEKDVPKLVSETEKLFLFYSNNAKKFSSLSHKQRQQKFGKLSLFRYCEEKDVEKLALLPQELLNRAQEISKGKEQDFYSEAFVEGCIAKKVNAMSQYISKNE
uniref:Uncharacterized protein n=1 Tax=Marseillevirus sp. TaxID=2809551 RepID=A0AA96ETA3_9VIRU|nr:hypothetical protein MarQu_312 [Marseillevirus sp.]WNL50481.1 hypothetical protein MarDSR_442 [Marseillevirus sp.]